MAITLSIEELVYCFYSEGLFEQGAAAKQAYFEGLSDEQMDLLFQAACRSLLSKDYLIYEQHRFSLKKEIADIICALNFSPLSLKVSRFIKEEDTISVHFSGERIYCHSLIYEGQVHVFEAITGEEVPGIVGRYLGIADRPVKKEPILSISQPEFESMLSMLDEDSAQVPVYLQSMGEDAPSIERFAGDMVSNSGYMDSILFLQFNEKREPVLSDILFTIKGESDSWAISRAKDNKYMVNACNCMSLRTAIEKIITAIDPALCQSQRL
ncbi:hypothetical protein [Aneurinibacillus tyrosinisolvens]|uniref:hypothetical protein n=1 Tax=Aneurinibacillus tyrosinisolvens TaxID=1443435 RepID=UPI00063EDE92|nr:hypothetical protein [Aneurinibacillus tyrosinisolvens]